MGGRLRGNRTGVGTTAFPLRPCSAVLVACFVAVAARIEVAAADCLTPPTDLSPPDGAVVTVPPSFGWVPGDGNEAIYLNVSTEPDLDPINVVNWADDGLHHFTGQVDGFRALVGTTLYWRLVADGCGLRAATPVRSFVVGDVSVDPYYDLYHLGWPGGAWPGWDPHDLSTIEAADLAALRERVGTGGATPDRKLGVSFHVPYFFTGDLSHYQDLLRRLFTVVEAADMPVLIGLDGFEWWGGRPDLWNWWDPSRPGYDDANRNNVEWTSWSPADAVREGWRNWGSPFRLGEPHPNVTSPRVLDANREALAALVPLIREWYETLAPERRYLLAGVKVGWEVNIGTNYFYPLDGADCVVRGTCDPDHAYPVGYAAVSTAGIRTTGTPTADDIARAVRIYMERLTQVVYEGGIPRNKIFTHVGAGTDSALSPYAQPGWSFYTFGAGPAGLSGLEATLDRVAATGWAVSEWGGPGSGAPVAVWRAQLEDYFHHRNNKLLAGFVGLDDGFAAALGQVIDRVDCWMHPPVLRASVAGHDAVLTWAIPGRAVEVYLNVTTDPTPDVHAGFVTVDVVNDRVTGTYRRELAGLGAGTYYAKLFADGCGRRVVSDLATFAVRDDPDGDAGDDGEGSDGGFDDAAIAPETGADGGEIEDAGDGAPDGAPDGEDRASPGGCGCRAGGGANGRVAFPIMVLLLSPVLRVPRRGSRSPDGGPARGRSPADRRPGSPVRTARRARRGAGDGRRRSVALPSPARHPSPRSR